MSLPILLSLSLCLNLGFGRWLRQSPFLWQTRWLTLDCSLFVLFDFVCVVVLLGVLVVILEFVQYWL